jgi:hypothetical protein
LNGYAELMGEKTDAYTIISNNSNKKKKKKLGHITLNGRIILLIIIVGRGWSRFVWLMMCIKAVVNTELKSFRPQKRET